MGLSFGLSGVTGSAVILYMSIVSPVGGVNVMVIDESVFSMGLTSVGGNTKELIGIYTFVMFKKTILPGGVKLLYESFVFSILLAK
jgi:hypothetical protein